MSRSPTFCRHRLAADRGQNGFTLIELMVVVAIVALIATIAVPSYLDYVRKTRRADAITRLSQVQQAQERFRANNASYASNLTGSPPAGLGIPASVSDGYYTLSLTGSATATGYTILATATGGQLSDTRCRVLSLTMSAGNTTLASATSGGAANAGADNNRCWNR